MADFSVRSDHIDVEQIMRQIKARIRDKRGADYTEAEIRELASVKLDKFLDPRAVRSDLLQHFRREREASPLIRAEEMQPPLYDFNGDTVYVSDRGLAGRILTAIRKLLKPVTKLFFHVDTLWDVLSKQSRMNAQNAVIFQRLNEHAQARDALNFEMFNNLVVELTRLGIEVKNLRMQVESFGTRLDFDERRARALEGVVQYKPGAPVARPQPPPQSPSLSPSPSEDGGDEGETGADAETRSARRRRRRRGRRRGPGDGPDETGPAEERSGAATSLEPEQRPASRYEGPGATGSFQAPADEERSVSDRSDREEAVSPEPSLFESRSDDSPAVDSPAAPTPSAPADAPAWSAPPPAAVAPVAPPAPVEPPAWVDTGAPRAQRIYDRETHPSPEPDAAPTPPPGDDPESSRS